MSARVRLDLTAAQARTVNAALALFEAEAWAQADYGGVGVRGDVIGRTRDAVHAALDRAGVTP